MPLGLLRILKEEYPIIVTNIFSKLICLTIPSQQSKCGILKFGTKNMLPKRLPNLVPFNLNELIEID